MIRYGYPFAGVHRIFDLTVRFANRASDLWGRFLGRIVEHPEEVAVGVDARVGSSPLASLVCPRSFGLEAGRSYPGEGFSPLNFVLRRLLVHFLAP